MKQDKTSRHKVVLSIDPLYMRIGAHGTELVSNGVFMMETTVIYLPEIRPQEDDPGCDKYCEILEARVFKTLVLVGEGLTLTIDHTVNILDLISDSQYEQLVDLVYAQGDFHG